MRLVRILAQALFTVSLVFAVVALVGVDLAVAFEGDDVGGDPVEEPAIVRNHHHAARELENRFFQRAQGFDVEVVGRFVEQQQVAAAAQQLGQVQAVALAAGKVLDEFLLRRPAEVEARYIGARRNFVVADDDIVEAVGDFFPDGLAAVEIVARLIDVGELDRIADFDRALVERSPGRPSCGTAWSCRRRWGR